MGLLLLLLLRMMRMGMLLLMVPMPVLVRMLRMPRLLQHVITRWIRTLLFVMCSRVSRVIVLSDLRVIVQRFLRGWQLMKIVTGTSDWELIVGLMVMVMVKVMTRRLMMQLLFRSRVTGGHHRALMKTVPRGRSRMMMMMVVSVRCLLDVVALVRIYWPVSSICVLMLLIGVRGWSG